MPDFDPAMVERLCIAMQSADVDPAGDTDWYRSLAVATLTALPIPAAALNAIEAGEAVVVSVKHYHIDNRKDTRCASCGHDLRHSIHLRVGEEAPDLRSASPYTEKKDG